MAFYDQCEEHPVYGWITPARAWAPILGLTEDEMTAEYEMQMAFTGTFGLRPEWVRHAQRLIAEYGTEDLVVIWHGEKARR